MKLAIPAEGKNLESAVNRMFGRTPYYLLVESATLAFTVLDNEAANVAGGAGIKAAQSIVDSGAEAVITFQCGQNAADVLQAAGIKIFRAEAGNIREVVQKYQSGELAPLMEIHSGYHHHGGK